MNSTARRYAAWALTLLVLTMLAGVWLRAVFAWPALRGGAHGPYLVHAHSHAGFFGWAVLAWAAVVTARLRHGRVCAAAHAVLAPALGLGSVAAFTGFLLRGYDTATITLSALHVLLWVALAGATWAPLAALDAAPRRWLRTSLAFLVAAGLATTAPVLMMVRGTTDPWALQVGVKLFLTLFVSGFLLPSALGVLYGMARGARFATVSLACIALGAVPSSLLYVATPPPAPWLLDAGRAGLGLVGAGLVLAAVDVLGLRAWRTLPPLAVLGALSAALAGGVKVLGAAGVGATIMHSRGIVVAVLHLVLLGVITPAFLQALRPGVHAARRVAGYAVSLAVMLAAVAVTGWPWAARLVMSRGAGLDDLLALAAVAGIAATGFLLALLAPARVTPAAATLPDGQPGPGSAAPAPPLARSPR